MFYLNTCVFCQSVYIAFVALITFPYRVFKLIGLCADACPYITAYKKISPDFIIGPVILQTQHILISVCETSFLFP